MASLVRLLLTHGHGPTESLKPCDHTVVAHALPAAVPACRAAMRLSKNDPFACYSAAAVALQVRHPQLTFDVLSNLLPVAYQLLDSSLAYDQVCFLCCRTAAV